MDTKPILSLHFLYSANLDLEKARELPKKEVAETKEESLQKMQIDGLLRSAISRAYYAVFHHLCLLCATSLIRSDTDDGKDMWVEVYRSVDHQSIIDACVYFSKDERLSADVKNALAQVKPLQAMRHNADYNPLYKPTLSEVEVWLATVQDFMLKIVNIMPDRNEQTGISIISTEIALHILLDDKKQKGLKEARRETLERRTKARRAKEKTENLAKRKT